MALNAGFKLGPYEIIGLLGAGGMGEVYRARDSRLGREVALKILPESFAREPERLRRFEQEARAVAALNHPNILAIHDIGESPTPYLVSELLEGESLRGLLDRGVPPTRKAIDYGVQIAHGLAAAHEKGIVHRDLKPENIFLTKDGRIKILDFGLAKLAPRQNEEAVEVTLTSSHTAAGVVMGTASYMAPEQVRGEPVDARADIFAFGAMLYEMLSGVQAFKRDTAVETMTAILKEDPPELSERAPLVSPALDRIVRRCLEKNPEQRFQSARDLSFALSAFSGTEASTTARTKALKTGSTPKLAWLYVAMALIAVAAVTWFVARRPAPVARMQFAIPEPERTAASQMALTRDGSMLAFVSPDPETGLPMVYVQHIGSAELKMLVGTQNASFPFWSPDNSFLAFFANGKLMKIPAAGGSPQVLASALWGRGGSWGSQNVIVYAPDSSSSIWRINSDGSGGAPLISPQEWRLHLEQASLDQSDRWPVFLPDGKRFLYWAGNFSNAKEDTFSGIYQSSLDDPKKRTLVQFCRCSVGYDSQNLYYADGQRQLVRVGFDPSSGKVSGSPVVIANAVGFQPSTYYTAMTAAANGTVVYSNGVGAALSVLSWMDRSGKELGQIGEPGVLANPALSPDGGRVAVDIADLKASNVDIWLESTHGGGNTRFTFDPAEEVAGVWSRDASKIAYRTLSAVNGSVLTIKASSGLEREKSIQGNPIDDFVPNSWSADNQQILYTQQSPLHELLVTVPAAGGKATPFITSSDNQTNGQISGDGRWVAYASDESGNWEIYVTSFPGAAGKWQVSRGGGTEPRWRGDGKEIFYIGLNGMLMSVAVSNEQGFSTSAPTPLFQIHGRAPISSTDMFTYDVTKDGQRFLVNRYVPPQRTEPLTILLNAGQ